MDALAKRLMKLGIGAHARLYTMTGGRVGGSMRGVPVVVVTTLGRTSGRPWTVPLMDVDHEGFAHVIASAGGAPEPPAWYHNLKATPTVGVQRGAEAYRATAVELQGEERDAVYAKAEARMDNFTEYAERAGRVIPVIRLVPDPA